MVLSKLKSEVSFDYKGADLHVKSERIVEIAGSSGVCKKLAGLTANYLDFPEIVLNCPE